MDFRILGPLEVIGDEGRPLDLGGRRQRAVLAVLLLEPGGPVSTDRLADRLWGEQRPRTALASLQNTISRLRKLLGADRVITRAPGYALRVAPDEFDLSRFEQLVDEARGLSGEARRDLLRNALGLWRGPPLADLAFEPFALLEVPRLEELRLFAERDLIEAELVLGRHADFLPELERLVSEHPFDERLRGQLMLALYRCGRQVDALAAYREARAFLVEELGLEPSSELRELEQAMLRQDAALAAPGPSPLAPQLPVRKTVTVLVADFVDSTGLADRFDPEALGRVLERIFTSARTIVERHGGTFQRFVGDAAVAVFGLPVVHEDDALRAVRVAVELREAAAESGEELELRIGVDTGEVFAGGADASSVPVTGAALNFAKQIEENAAPGEILLGPTTVRLVAGAAEVEERRPLRLGNGRTLGVWRLLTLVEGAPAIRRRFEAPLVGRDRELERLRRAFEEVREVRRCRLLVLAGEPGIGKTRLAREFTAEAREHAIVLVGKCVSYGEGATWLPLVGIVADAGGSTPEGLMKLLAGVADAELVAARITDAIGAGVTEATSVEEMAWAFRRFLEALARTHPLVVVLEDVHWAEPTLLDLVDQLADRSSGSILVLCLARPELLDDRPAWRGMTTTLAALSDGDVARIVDSLGTSLDTGIRARVVEVGEGNPLFVEQLVAHAEEEGGQHLDVIPPSIEALLASRIDLLRPYERAVLERAAIVGREFRRDAVVELSAPGEGRLVEAELKSLIEKGLLRADRLRDATSAFHHVLVRDVVYAGMTKASRAELHLRFANWLESAPDGHPPDEVVAYHLEQAARCKDDLGEPDAELTVRAGERLADAGRRALWRTDYRAAAGLLERALDLLRPLRFDVELELDFAAAQPTSREAADFASATADRARAMGDDAGATLARVVAHGLTPDPDVEEAEALARAALPLFEEARDHHGLVRIWATLGAVANVRGHFEEWAYAAEQAIHHSRLAEHEDRRLFGLPMALVVGPRPADQALQVLEAFVSDPLQHGLLMNRAVLLAMLSRFEDAWALARGASAQLLELIGEHRADLELGHIAVFAGDHAAAVEYFRRGCDILEKWGDLGVLSVYAPALGRELCTLGRFDEAEELAQRGREVAVESDVLAQAIWRQVQARVQAHRGEHVEAQALAREATTILGASDCLNFQGEALTDLADVLHSAGRIKEAVEALEQALERYERKKNLAMVAQVSPKLDALREMLPT